MTLDFTTVATVAKNPRHTFHKPTIDQITLLTGLGVEGDAHMGVTVKHRSRVKADPTQPNLRQIHIIQSELFDELRDKGFEVKAGDMGENITTRGMDLLGLPRGTLPHIGDEAIVEVTGLRNPYSQIDDFQKGLLKAVLDRDAEGGLVRKAGIMGIIIQGGVVKADDEVRAVLPPKPHHKLERV
ncbi:MAG: MOSC domain-containing protein [Alphaproteobacteria bacterium]|nr:MOSC domain-containing protein [Alphaproteobacteria bacterium]